MNTVIPGSTYPAKSERSKRRRRRADSHAIRDSGRKGGSDEDRRKPAKSKRKSKATDSSPTHEVWMRVNVDAARSRIVFGQAREIGQTVWAPFCSVFEDYDVADPSLAQWTRHGPFNVDFLAACHKGLKADRGSAGSGGGKFRAYAHSFCASFASLSAA